MSGALDPAPISAPEAVAADLLVDPGEALSGDVFQGSLSKSVEKSSPTCGLLLQHGLEDRVLDAPPPRRARRHPGSPSRAEPSRARRCALRCQPCRKVSRAHPRLTPPRVCAATWIRRRDVAVVVAALADFRQCGRPGPSDTMCDAVDVPSREPARGHGAEGVVALVELLADASHQLGGPAVVGGSPGAPLPVDGSTEERPRCRRAAPRRAPRACGDLWRHFEGCGTLQSTLGFTPT